MAPEPLPEAEVPNKGQQVDPASEEERLRAERRSRAEAELAAFSEQRKREIEERQLRNREREAAAAVAAKSSQQSTFQVTPDLAAMAATLSAGGNSSGGGLPAAFASLMKDPSAAAMLQQALPALAAQLSNSSSPSGSSAPSAFTVRVRESGSDRGTFRRVVLAEEQSGKSSVAFEEVERRICSKFQTSRKSDGSEVGARRLVTLVRLRDKLEVLDDEDATLLQEGDELEATFAAL